MIVGLFLRNYKCYGKLNFIPLASSPTESLNVLIGANGVGKSSLLDALNCILNELDPRTWEITIGEKRDRTYIGPVFLIPKSRLAASPKLQAISDVFWNDGFANSPQSEAVAKFVSWRDELKKQVDPGQYYLICVGRDSNGNILLTSTFHNKIFNQTKRFGVSKAYIGEIFKEVISLYSYIYIPVENRVSDILNLQAKEMQGLMDKSVADEIRGILSTKEYGESGAKRKLSVVDLINTKLDLYIDEINAKMTSGYRFAARGTNKKTIKPNDILQIILNEYFSIRPLTKDGKNINSLSSGQQRLALIDVASTLLAADTEKSRSVILAIDEPESSLEAANRFKQFSRLVEIGEKKGHQILVTTHWYGLLLRPSSGRLTFVSEQEDAPDVKAFSMKNLYDHRRMFPDSIEMKSYFDLMASMLSLIKQDCFSWIICEGYEDAEYLNFYLRDRLPNVYVLPFNGCGNVKKLFNFLSVPFSDKHEMKQIKGKILCLIDTDEKNLINIQGYSAAAYENKLRFDRLSLDRSNERSRLISVADPNATNTCIEDVLEPRLMWEAFRVVADSDPDIGALATEYSFNDNAVYADVTKRLHFLKRNSLRAHERADRLQELLCRDHTKRALAHAYVAAGSQFGQSQSLSWVEDIVAYFREGEEVEAEARGAIAAEPA